MKKIITVETGGERLDVFLAINFAGYSRSYFQKLVKDLKVKVNSGSEKANYLTKAGDVISVDFFSARKEIVAEKIKLRVIHEDKDIIVINKPVGMVVHPACGHFSGTLLNALFGLAGGHYIPFLVHRLDKNTSGIIVVAKNEKAKNSLIKQFEGRKVKKTYLALAKGLIKEDKGRIDASLGRSIIDRKKISVGPMATKEAVTEFNTLRREKEYTLVEVHPLTGRTHQIRSHLSYIGHPIMGDETYGGPMKINGYPLARQMLHAYKISFFHPSKKKIVEFKADIPDDFKQIVGKL